MTIGTVTLGTGVNDGTGTSITIPITPPAAGTYDTIEVRYRIVGTASWSDGGNYVGTPETAGNHQISGLTGARTYEVIAWAVLASANGEPAVPVRVKCSVNTSPVAERIVDDITADLAAITTGNGYYQTVKRVTRLGSLASAVVNTPMIGVYIQSEQNLDEELEGTYGLTTRDLTVSFRLYTGDPDDPDEALSYLAADVDKALLADPHRSALAQNTVVKSVVRDYLDPDGGEITGEATVTVVCRYQQKLTDPYESR